jgi:hypothetical protein
LLLVRQRRAQHLPVGRAARGRRLGERLRGGHLAYVEDGALDLRVGVRGDNALPDGLDDGLLELARRGECQPRDIHEPELAARDAVEKRRRHHPVEQAVVQPERADQRLDTLPRLV